MAGIVERNLVAVIIGIPAIVLSGTSGVVFWGMLPERWQHRLKPGTELLLILPLLVLGGWLAAVLAPWVERAFFGGDLRLWLNSVGFTYDQRNSLVVAWRWDSRSSPSSSRFLTTRSRACRRASQPLRSPSAPAAGRRDADCRANREPRRVLGGHGGLRPRRGRDHDRG